MQNIEDIKKVIEEKNLKVLKSLGQNFLIDRKVLEDIVDAAELKTEDVVVEVGPGMGVLTFALSQKCRKVIAVEKDRKMSDFLRKEVLKRGLDSRVEIVHDDILKINLPQFLRERGISDYKLVANIPYYITSPIIKLFLETEIQPEMMVMLVQKEVAERVCAPRGDLSVLALSVLLYGEPTIIRKVDKASFYPAPKVDSAILKIENISKKYSDADYKKLFWLIKIGFSAKRKKLANNLAAGLKIDKSEVEKALSSCGIDVNARAQDLGVVDWVKIKETRLV